MKVYIALLIALLLGSPLTRIAAASAPLLTNTLPALTLSGGPINIAAQKGWRVVYFWSEDCSCVRDCERLSLIHLAEKYNDKVAFYAVDSNATDIKGNRQALKANIAIHHLPYPVLLDPAHSVANALKAVSTPQAFLLSPSNEIVFQGAPDDSLEFKARTGRPGITHAYLADAIAEALAGKAVLQPVIKSLGCGIIRD